MKNVDFPRFSARKPYVFFHCFWTFLDPFWRRSLRPKPHRGPGVPCLESLPWLGGAELGEPHEPATETAARERRPGRERAQNTRKSRVFGAMSIDFRWSSMVFSHVFPWFSMFFAVFSPIFPLKSHGDGPMFTCSPLLHRGAVRPSLLGPGAGAAAAARGAAEEADGGGHGGGARGRGAVDHQREDEGGAQGFR